VTVYIVVVLSNELTLLNLHNSFEFFPSLSVAHAAVHSTNSASHFVIFVHILLHLL
jgi:hypothetical protein